MSVATPGIAPSSSDADQRRRSNIALLKRLAVVVVGMFGFGYLLVPFYDQICNVTGLRNIAQADEAVNTQVVATRSVRIELDSNLSGMPWTFRPLETIVSVHPGEVRQVIYEVVNTTDRVITGQAVPSYGPQRAAKYFQKLECFCFTTQTLQPGEVRQMPVVFVVDPAAPEDLVTITLSYTFFEVEGAGSAKLPIETGRRGRTV